MTAPKGATTSADRMHWLKFNPTEWVGLFPDLDDAESGLLIRVLALLWATPGNRMTLPQLLTRLRVTAESERGTRLRGLIGYALQEGPEEMLHLPYIDEAFAGAQQRSTDARKAAEARHRKPAPALSPSPNPRDF